MRRGPAPAPVDDAGEEVAAAPPVAVEPVREAPRHVLQTEFDFVLPRGFVDFSGAVHRNGTMRLATARDELLPLHDDRVRENPPYLTVVLLARVITALGDLEGDEINAGVVERFFASDLAFLQDLYRRINSEGHSRAAVSCPACHERFSVELAGGRLGES